MLYYDIIGVFYYINYIYTCGGPHRNMLWLAAPAGTTSTSSDGPLGHYYCASDAGSYMGRLPRPPLFHQGPMVLRVQ